MAVKLAEALGQYGCDADPAEFRDSLRELRGSMFPAWTDEELLYHLREAGQFVRAARAKFGTRLPDWLILRTLVNVRKNPRARA